MKVMKPRSQQQRPREKLSAKSEPIHTNTNIKRRRLLLESETTIIMNNANNEHDSCLHAAVSNLQNPKRDTITHLQRRLYALASESKKSISAANLVLPDEALTLENLKDLFTEIGWETMLIEQELVVSANFASGLGDDDLTASIIRYPSGFRFLMDWYIRPETSLGEKLLFVNEANVTFAGLSMAYMGVPMGAEGLFTPRPGVVGTCCHLVAGNGLTFNQITMGLHYLIKCTLVVAAMAHNRGLLDEQRWPLTRVKAVSDVAAECDAHFSEPDQ